MELTVIECGPIETRYGRIGKIGSGKKDGMVCFTGISKEWRETLVIGGKTCLGFEVTGEGILYYKVSGEVREVIFDRLYLDLSNTGYVLCIENKNTYGNIKLRENGCMTQWYAEPVC